MWKIICSWQLSWWLSGVKGEEPGLNHLDFKLELPVETNIHPSRRLQWGLIEILTVHLLKHTNFNSFHIHTFMNYKYKLHFQSNLVQIWRNFWKLEWDAFKENLDTLKTKLFMNIWKCDTRYLQCQDMKLMCDLCNWSEQPTGGPYASDNWPRNMEKQ